MRNVPIEPGRPTITMKVPGIQGAVRRVYPWYVRVESTPQEPNLGSRAIAWAKENFGPAANIYMPSKLVIDVEVEDDYELKVRFMKSIPFEYPTDHRWDYHHPHFYFRDQSDATGFRMMWG